VAYTIAGLDPDASGTVTFADTHGHTVVSSTINTNGTFHIDLSSLDDGPVTSVFHVTDSAGYTVDATGNTVQVTVVNDPPSGTDNAIAINEDGSHTFTAADFGFSDPSDGNAFLAVKIATIPGAGSLTNNNAAVNPGDVVNVTDINAGKLVFTPA